MFIVLSAVRKGGTRATLRLPTCNTRAPAPSLWAHSGRTPMATPSAHRAHSRPFSHTPARRYFETVNQTLAFVVGAFAGAFAVGRLAAMVRPFFVAPVKGINLSAVPPLSWLASVDDNTRDGVLVAVTAGFKLARSRPGALREPALRQATFAMPYEVARLNTAAPDFRIEDVGPGGELSADAQDFLSAQDRYVKLALDLEKDTRFFLYFPSPDAEKATAAFLAINARLDLPDLQKWGKTLTSSGTPNASSDTSSKPPACFNEASAQNRHLRNFALVLWASQYRHWLQQNPDMLEKRFQPGQLPVILCFREVMTGSFYDQEQGIFPHPETTALVMGMRTEE